jgi:hypothetical protein
MLYLEIDQHARQLTISLGDESGDRSATFITPFGLDQDCRRNSGTI